MESSSGILVSLLTGTPTASLPLEIVERKGLGHPDSVCDALVENLSLALSRFYLERFGAILHHNVDKGLLWGGAAYPAFGGGEITEPIEVYIAGRATANWEGVTIPVDELAVEESRRWIRNHLRFLDPERHVRIHPRIRHTSPDLVSLFQHQRAEGVPLANDTSFGVCFAPFDELERVVLAVEQRLNSRAVKAAHPEIGEDIKVMGTRRGDAIVLTVACALVGRYVADLPGYRAKKEQVRQIALEAARAIAHGTVEVSVNTADSQTADGIYLTVTGLSAEGGDDGQVGRGNRVNGLITPYRPMSLEAVAGKNPVSHVGKLYNMIANEIAAAVVEEIAGVQEAYCMLVSQIGRPITDPQLLDLKLRLEDAAAIETIRPRAAEIVASRVGQVATLWRELVEGRRAVA